MTENSWTIQEIWNDTFVGESTTEVKPRDYIRASEIGKSFLDRYYAMTGVEWTHPFDARVLRIFEAGNIYEWLVRLVLIRAGILRHDEKEIKIEPEGILPVIGHLDFIAGGKPDWKQAQSIVPLLEQLFFPKRMLVVSEKLIESLSKKYPDGLPEQLFEVKTVNSLAFWRHSKGDKQSSSVVMQAYDHHIMQIYTYMKGLGLKKGLILYLSKDDLTLAEYKVTADEELEHKWLSDVQTMTHHYNQKIQPQREPDMVWDQDKFYWRPNWQIVRSNYFGHIVKDMTKEEWDRQIKNLCNRCKTRIKNLKKENPSVPSMQVRSKITPYIKEELGKIYGGSGNSLIQKPIAINHG